ncbi:MAG: AbrB/MazE/SpoVT family DNA-binding domain-containing protein [Sulfobacillus sp.]
MIQARLRKVGNSLVMTLPQNEARRLAVSEGDLVMVDIRTLETRLHLSCDDDTTREMREMTRRNKHVLEQLKD